MYKIASLFTALILGLIVSRGPASAADAAADYPNKVVRIFVPFTPGGATDLLARGLAKHLSDAWKQPVVVENRPSAGGIVALRATLDAPADGYTLVAHSDGWSISPAIYAQLPYDVEKDFIPVGVLARAANVISVGATSPYKTLKELVDAGKKAGALTYASAGVGSAQHMQAAKFVTASGMVEPVHIPHRGTPESLTEVIAGRVDFVFAPMSSAMPFFKSGSLRPLAISTVERSPLLKDVPTIAESGFPNFSERQWWGVFAPAKTPPEIVAKIEQETRNAVKDPQMLQLIEQLSSEPGDLFGTEFAKFVTSEIAANKRAAVAGNITAK